MSQVEQTQSTTKQLDPTALWVLTDGETTTDARMTTADDVSHRRPTLRQNTGVQDTARALTHISSTVYIDASANVA
jgi:hypothetical protein